MKNKSWKKLRTIKTNSKLSNLTLRIIELISLDYEDIRFSNEAFNKLKSSEHSLSYVVAVQIGSAVLWNELQYFGEI